jgi:hypothetical protein
MPSWKAKKLGNLTQEKSTARTLKQIRQQYLMRVPLATANEKG